MAAGGAGQARGEQERPEEPSGEHGDPQSRRPTSGRGPIEAASSKWGDRDRGAEIEQTGEHRRRGVIRQARRHRGRRPEQGGGRGAADHASLCSSARRHGAPA